jgi:hypothetical protein
MPTPRLATLTPCLFPYATLNETCASGTAFPLVKIFQSKTTDQGNSSPFKPLQLIKIKDPASLVPFHEVPPFRFQQVSRIESAAPAEKP